MSKTIEELKNLIEIYGETWGLKKSGRWNDVVLKLREVETELSEQSGADKMIELVDGARNVIDLFLPETPAQEIWQREWLRRADVIINKQKQKVSEL